MQSFQTGLSTSQGSLILVLLRKSAMDLRIFYKLKFQQNWCIKNFLAKKSVFCCNSLEFNEVSKQLNRSISFPCGFPTVISYIMSPRTVNDQRKKLKMREAYDLFILVFFSQTAIEESLSNVPLSLEKKIHGGKKTN